MLFRSLYLKLEIEELLIEINSFLSESHLYHFYNLRFGLMGVSTWFTWNSEEKKFILYKYYNPIFDDIAEQ